MLDAKSIGGEWEFTPPYESVPVIKAKSLTKQKIKGNSKHKKRFFSGYVLDSPLVWGKVAHW